jgi:integrase
MFILPVAHDALLTARPMAPGAADKRVGSALACKVGINPGIGPTKTYQNRTVKVDPGTVSMLEDLQNGATGSQTFVLGLTPDKLTDRFRKLCILSGHIAKDAKPLYSFQGERKAHATELAGRGASPGNVQARLGHANLQATLGYYVHPLTTVDEELAETIGQLLDSA